MDIKDFQKAVGQQFRIPGLLPQGFWDVIIDVDPRSGEVKGSAIEAHYSYCHIKGEQPAQLKKSNDNERNKTTDHQQPAAGPC